jgi:hypothetical protein
VNLIKKMLATLNEESVETQIEPINLKLSHGFAPLKVKNIRFTPISNEKRCILTKKRKKSSLKYSHKTEAS